MIRLNEARTMKGTMWPLWESQGWCNEKRNYRWTSMFQLLESWRIPKSTSLAGSRKQYDGEGEDQRTNPVTENVRGRWFSGSLSLCSSQRSIRKGLKNERRGLVDGHWGCREESVSGSECWRSYRKMVEMLFIRSSNTDSRWERFLLLPNWGKVKTRH